MNQQEDFFRDIAMTKHPINEENMEIKPRKVKKRYFKEIEHEFPYDKTVFSREVSYENRLEEFHDELSNLRKHYKPYMANLLPQIPDTVEKLELKKFDFRYLNKQEVFTDINTLDIPWESITIPDYRGPANEDGKWRAYYRTNFSIQEMKENERVVIRFQSVDYKAFIYINGNYIGCHEGFFAPFEFDVTNYVSSENELIIECHNDIPILGVGPVLDGDKIYAATGPGWDDPEVGWHHCPAGAGVFGKVTVEYRPQVHINDIFVRPNIDEDYVEIRIGIHNYIEAVLENYKMEITLSPKNYTGNNIGNLIVEIPYIGVGMNEYRFAIDIKNYKLWDMNTPYLYGALVLLKKDDAIISTCVNTFGLKKFTSDETTEPKGKFYFNNRPIVLRGANEMGHLQQCVMNENFDQLIDDILIAKLANLNYYRITQRPVQEEIYDYFDMLGMFHQCDLPLFSFLRRNQFSEGIKQVTEMEHLIRGHVSSVMVSFINEPVCIRKTKDPNDKFSKRYLAKGHRHLLRDELEAFFVAARKAIYIENPDRVVKNVEGDYDPPTAEGLPDFHTYTMWYTNHGQPIGKLMKGYLPPVKEGWMIGCGEYGAEGLDNQNIMLEQYPKEWLKTEEDGSWYPDKIVRAQTHSVHGDWYQEQNNMKDWIAASQKHQAIATKLMTDAFRRRADLINHIAIHLLIDAWPSGWMKTLVGCDRIPKPAYFAYQDALEPLRVNLYSDRRYVRGNEKVDVEAWLLNDTSKTKSFCVLAALKLDNKVIKEYKLFAQAEEATSICAGIIQMDIPDVDKESILYLDSCIMDEYGHVINSERLEFYAYSQTIKKKENISLYTVGDWAKTFINSHDISCCEDLGCADVAFISDLSEKNLNHINEFLEKEKNVILILSGKENRNVNIGDLNITTKQCPEVFFAASEKELQKYHFNMLYNSKKDYIDFIGTRTIETSKAGEDLVYTYGKSGFTNNFGAKEKLPFVKKINYKKGTLFLVSMELDGRTSYNPNLDLFLMNLIWNKI